MTPTFLTPPKHLTLAEFHAYVGEIRLGAWRPRFPTLHNTGVPSLEQWIDMGTSSRERWGGNLNRYYQGLGWHAGPHLVICPDYVWILCDPTQPGVSVSCWNSVTFGVEMVGDYEAGGDAFDDGDGARVRDNAVAALSILANRFGWGDLADFSPGSRGLHFHRECRRDRHSCPGSRVDKRDLLERIGKFRYDESLGPAQHQTVVISPKDAPDIPFETPPFVAPSVKTLQGLLNQIGADPPLAIDGELGPLTLRAIKAFQRSHGLVVDGWVGPLTYSRLLAVPSAQT